MQDISQVYELIPYHSCITMRVSDCWGMMHTPGQVLLGCWSNRFDKVALEYAKPFAVFSGNINIRQVERPSYQYAL